MTTGAFSAPWLWTPRPSATLPQTALGTLFTASGGRWRLGGLIGRVTVALGATANDGKIVFDPAGGAADIDLTSVRALASLPQGRWLYFVGATLAVSDAEGAAVSATLSVGQPTNNSPFLPGNISLNTTANQTGEIEWWLAWLPLTPGARVVAA